MYMHIHKPPLEQDDAGEETFVAETQVDNANHETERRLSRHYHYDERRRTRRASSSYYAADHREKEMALLTEVLETLQTTKQEEQGKGSSSCSSFGVVVLGLLKNVLHPISCFGDVDIYI